MPDALVPNVAVPQSKHAVSFSTHHDTLTIPDESVATKTQIDIVVLKIFSADDEDAASFVSLTNYGGTVSN